ncbi:hypothetical protein PAHAL_3G484500 [Panicum hallii]|uniref:Uncharacterized protein n=1 Tax=Panicum hallii TaxID=206008 RepID=A0A2T8KLW1_9POAL|nr:hypothetical protein PAHAL_3G484500 [Panicum hallii]
MSKAGGAAGPAPGRRPRRRSRSSCCRRPTPTSPASSTTSPPSSTSPGSTSHPCATHRRPSRWRCAQPTWLASLNENVDRRIELLSQQAEGTERMLERIGQEAAASFKELEAHYYSSVVRSPSYD